MCSFSDTPQIKRACRRRAKYPGDEARFEHEFKHVQEGWIVFYVAPLKGHGATDVALNKTYTQSADENELVANQPISKFQTE